MHSRHLSTESARPRLRTAAKRIAVGTLPFGPLPLEAIDVSDAW